MKNKERIEEIERQIEELKAEKRALTGSTIAYKVNRRILLPFYDRWEKKITTGSRTMSCANSIWNPIVMLCKSLHTPIGKNQKIKISDLTEEQRNISSQMATEMVDIWNKYVQKVYGNETDDK